MKSKRFFLILMVAIMVISSVITGCTVVKEGSDTETEPVGTASQPTSPKEPLFPLEKTGGIFLPITDQPIEYSMALAEHPNYAYKKDIFIAQKYLEEWTGVKFNIIPIPNASYDDKIAIYFTSGALPDIVPLRLNDSYEGGMEGLLLPLDDLIDEYAKNVKKLDQESYPNSLKVSTAADGNIYCLPNYKNDDPKRTYIYRKDLLEEMGLGIPETMDDFFTALRTAKEKYEDMIPFMTRRGKNGAVLNEISAAYDCYAEPSNIIVIEDEKATIGVKNPMAKKLVSDFRILYQEELMNQNYILGDANYWEEKLLTGKALCTFDDHGRTGRFNDSNAAAEKPIEGFMMTRAMPPIPEGGSGNQQKLDYLEVWVTSFNKNIKNPEIAMQAMDFLYSDLGMDLTQYGVEGITFEYAESGAHNINKDIVKSGEAPWGPNALENMFHGFYYPTFIKRNEKRLVDTMQNATQDSLNWQIAWKESNRTRPPQPVFAFNKEESEIWADNYDAVEKHFIVNIDKFIMGTRSMDEWDEFISELEKLGALELVKVKQQQYDRSN